VSSSSVVGTTTTIATAAGVAVSASRIVGASLEASSAAAVQVAAGPLVGASLSASAGAAVRVSGSAQIGAATVISLAAPDVAPPIALSSEAPIGASLSALLSPLARLVSSGVLGASATGAIAAHGAMGFTNQTSPVSSYLAWMSLNSSNSAMSPEIHDRLAHLGGLVLNVTTSQAVTGLDLATLGVVADRLGDANYSDVQWWLEVYTDGGATASNATINVTYDDASTGNLTVVAVGGTLRAGRLIPLTPLIPTAQQGKFIKGVNSVILSASTGTAGNFGFTATRPRTAVSLEVANKTERFTWADLGLPEIPNDSCLQVVMITSTTSSGTLRGGGKIAHI